MKRLIKSFDWIWQAGRKGVAIGDWPLDGGVAICDSLNVKLIFSPAAIKAMTKLPPKDAAGLLTKLGQFAAEPMGQYHWAKRLTDQPGFRVRHGDWRAVFRLDHHTGEMIVDRIAKRDEVYR
ncbi:MAG: hypothetical protein HQL40_00340 [Alphaproteobacteria bacterium]|nr:hypothetical protein [Alphaproteobacteria bacterium]